MFIGPGPGIFSWTKQILNNSLSLMNESDKKAEFLYEQL